MSIFKKKRKEEDEGSADSSLRHPHNHDGDVPVVTRADVKEILDSEGPEHFKVRMNDGSIAVVAFKEEKEEGEDK